MSTDYRWSSYEGQPSAIKETKNHVEEFVRINHPRKKDLYPVLRDNKGEYKRAFLQAYGGKCAYCGASIKLMPIDSFEIDHYIPQTDARFTTQSDAGYMDNLVLACFKCNRNKSDYLIAEDYLELLHPDTPGIQAVFFRDNDFYIRIAEAYSDDIEVRNFYEKLKLYDECIRLDFLLMSLKGLAEKYKDNKQVYGTLSEACLKLQEKRNLGVISSNE